MRLKKLLQDVEILKSNVNLEIKIENITSDSRKASKNSVFVAIKGETRDGNKYIKDALKNGAIAVVTDATIRKRKNVPIILVENAREALAKMWSAFYSYPSKDMKVIAITGTNGKTTTSYFLYNILRKANKSCGLISTVECLINDSIEKHSGGSDVSDKHSAMTTPDPEILYKMLYKMKKKGVEYVVMEASSHALNQRKLDGLKVDVGVFTNLSSEHLDYHGSIENYFESKKILFKNSKINIINIDDSYGEKVYQMYRGRSLSVAINKPAYFKAENIETNSLGSKYDIYFEGNQKEVRTKLLGSFNVSNSMLAFACATALGVSSVECANGILSMKKVNGRLEKYKGKAIFIDYAHTPIATENVLKTLKSIYPRKKLIVLFGCGGDRDKRKRKEIGKICSKLADHLIITSDNSRSEDPNIIISQILEGVDENAHKEVMIDREKAIEFAVSIMNKNSILVLLGKGHENYEITKEGKREFDEKKILDRIFGI